MTPYDDIKKKLEFRKHELAEQHIKFNLVPYDTEYFSFISGFDAALATVLEMIGEIKERDIDNACDSKAHHLVRIGWSEGGWWLKSEILKRLGGGE